MPACLFGAFFLSACGSSEKIPYAKTGFYFDTVVTLTVYDTAKNADAANALLDEAMEECRRYDELFAPDLESSDIYRINHAGGESVHVSDETATMLYSALAYCRSFSGLADITIKPVKDLWDFTPQGGTIPSENSLSSALSHVNYQNVDLTGNKVSIADPYASIDPGFIAKGYIADQLKAFFISKNCPAAIINLGGNVQTLGTKPDQSDYSVGIRKPFGDADEYLTTISLSDADTTYSSAATSGIYERCFTVSDTLYHHILNPSTGMPAETDLYSATILTDSSMDADALSTICLMMGSEAAADYIRSVDGVDAILITDKYEIIDTRSSKSNTP